MGWWELKRKFRFTGDPVTPDINEVITMRSMRLGIVYLMLFLLASLAGGSGIASAQTTAKPDIGYAVKKPYFGGACPMCPWGNMANIVKQVMKPYGWDIQICYVCAGSDRAARLVAGKLVPPINPESTTQPNPPQAPLDFGATGTQFLWWAYQGTNPFAKDPEGPRRDLRLVANIEQPSFFLVAVRAESPITDLRQIRENRLKVKFVLNNMMRDTYQMMDHYNLSAEVIKELGGEIVGTAVQNRKDMDVVAGWASLVTAPEYAYWMDIAHNNKLRFLELPRDLLERWAKQMDMEVRNVPPGLLPGLENRTFPTVAKSGTVVYGRTDMPEEFAYTLAKALDENQNLLHWTHMNWFYNWRTVWKAYGVPLHPGAEKYYREVGYMK